MGQFTLTSKVSVVRMFSNHSLSDWLGGCFGLSMCIGVLKRMWPPTQHYSIATQRQASDLGILTSCSATTEKDHPSLALKQFANLTPMTKIWQRLYLMKLRNLSSSESLMSLQLYLFTSIRSIIHDETSNKVLVENAMESSKVTKELKCQYKKPVQKSVALKIGAYE
uniref:Uncharacterized protein n=1 Tax=Timema cristinae TaxID=61476 RepID=A0A7R9H130_TIMCR|nr:unnamed protein product [Timema cristinae]